mmetsp:Transcript_112079/g.327836  ORF Transcript_112079/g.327836 Transcript_112079/m.327836 type:complete len:333 (+) Transcript_112079:1547-2545(+)
MPEFHRIFASDDEIAGLPAPVHVVAGDELVDRGGQSVARCVSGPSDILQDLRAAGPLADRGLDDPVAEGAVQANNLSRPEGAGVHPVAGAAKEGALVWHEVEDFCSPQDRRGSGCVRLVPAILVGVALLAMHGHVPEACPLITRSRGGTDPPKPSDCILVFGVVGLRHMVAPCIEVGSRESDVIDIILRVLKKHRFMTFTLANIPVNEPLVDCIYCAKVQDKYDSATKRGTIVIDYFCCIKGLSTHRHALICQVDPTLGAEGLLEECWHVALCALHLCYLRGNIFWQRSCLGLQWRWRRSSGNILLTHRQAPLTAVLGLQQRAALGTIGNSR